MSFYTSAPYLCVTAGNGTLVTLYSTELSCEATPTCFVDDAWIRNTRGEVEEENPIINCTLPLSTRISMKQRIKPLGTPHPTSQEGLHGFPLSQRLIRQIQGPPPKAKHWDIRT
jgi:hypothetical protein